MFEIVEPCSVCGNGMTFYGLIGLVSVFLILGFVACYITKALIKYFKEKK